MRNSLIVAVLSAFVLAISIVVILPLFVSSELVRNTLQREMSSFIGQSVRLDGQITLSLFPTPVVHFEGLTSPADAAREEAFLTIDEAEANIALLTLLSSTPEFTAFRIERPALKLRRSTDGSINWRTAFGRINQAVAQAERTIRQINAESEGVEEIASEDLLDTGFPSRLGNIVVTNGSIEILSPDGTAEDAFTAINGVINWQDIKGAASVNFEGVWRGQPTAFAIQANAPLAFLAGDKSDMNIDVQASALELTYDGMLGEISNVFADGSLTLQTQSLSALLDWLGIGNSPGRAVGEVSISGPIRINDGRASIEASTMSISGSAGQGILELFDDPDGVTMLSGTMDFEALDLALLLSAFIDVPSNPFTSTRNVDLGFMSELKTDLRISAQSATAGNLSLTNLAATAQINKYSAIFDLGDAELFGGNIQSRLQFSMGEGQDEKMMRISVATQELDTRQASGAIALPEILPIGTTNLSLDASAPIGTWSEMAGKAKGEVTASVTEGTTRGFGVDTLLSSEGRSQFFNLTSSENADESFSSFDLLGAIGDGVMTIKTGDIQYADGSIAFDGVAPFRSGGIALSATAKPNAEEGLEATEGERRFFVGGSWTRAFATPLLPGIQFNE